MPYTTNPHLPRLRMEAAQLFLEQGWSTLEVARHTGFDQSTIVRWVAKAKITKRIAERGMAHRHSRVRTPNDNAHLERFNRTLQEECLTRSSRSLTAWRKAIPDYLHWYNEERPHMGLAMRTPLEVMRSY